MQFAYGDTPFKMFYHNGIVFYLDFHYNLSCIDASFRQINWFNAFFLILKALTE